MHELSTLVVIHTAHSRDANARDPESENCTVISLTITFPFSARHIPTRVRGCPNNGREIIGQGNRGGISPSFPRRYLEIAGEPARHTIEIKSLEGARPASPVLVPHDPRRQLPIIHFSPRPGTISTLSTCRGTRVGARLELAKEKKKETPLRRQQEASEYATVAARLAIARRSSRGRERSRARGSWVIATRAR